MMKIKLIATLFLVLAPGAVIMQNRNPVQTHLLLITVAAPLILLYCFRRQELVSPLARLRRFSTAPSPKKSMNLK